MNALYKNISSFKRCISSSTMLYSQIEHFTFQDKFLRIIREDYYETKTTHTTAHRDAYYQIRHWSQEQISHLYKETLLDLSWDSS